MDTNMIYLVTGGAGFLGNAVCSQLVEQGQEVRAFILPNDPAKKHIPEAVEIFEGDLTDIESIRPFFVIPEGREAVVLHIASLVTSKPDFNQKVIDVNVGGTKNIIELCLTMPRIEKLVYCSSTGAIPEQPKGTLIKEIDYFKPGSEELAENAAQALKDEDVIILKNHGVIATGSTVKEAAALVEFTEEIAKTQFVSHVLNSIE